MSARRPGAVGSNNPLAPMGVPAAHRHLVGAGVSAPSTSGARPCSSSSASSSTGQFYAVARGHQPGVYTSWAECEPQIRGFPDARHKKFKSQHEAVAFIQQNAAAPSASAVKRFIDRQRKIVSDLVETAENGADPYANNESDDWSAAPVVYTDGACSNNGRANAKAGVGVFWGDGHPDNYSEPARYGATNNAAEFEAVYTAVCQAQRKGLRRLVVRTDSNLLVKSMNDWMPKWRRNGWRTADGEQVKNCELLQCIDQLRQTVSVKFEHIRGHSGHYGNEQADRLAREGAVRFVPVLNGTTSYSGGGGGPKAKRAKRAESENGGPSSSSSSSTTTTATTTADYATAAAAAFAALPFSSLFSFLPTTGKGNGEEERA